LPTKLFFKSYGIKIGLQGFLFGNGTIVLIFRCAANPHKTVLLNGIQKALGDKRRFILLQFLFESILLSTFGVIIAGIVPAISTARLDLVEAIRTGM